MKNVLIVEDELFLAMELKETLEKNNFFVLKITSSHKETISILNNNNNKIDIVLMDININGPIDGIQSCDYISINYKLPVLLISSYYDKETLSLVRDSFASGYLTKPYMEEELLVLLTITLKSSNSKVTHLFNEKVNLKNNLIYSEEENKLLKNNIELRLTKKEKKLIKCLCKEKNNYVSYEKIFFSVWEKQKFSINKIRGMIFRLKKKIPSIALENNQEYGYKID